VLGGADRQSAPHRPRQIEAAANIGADDLSAADEFDCSCGSDHEPSLGHLSKG
jgi:hypothetical protein